MEGEVALAPASSSLSSQLIKYQDGGWGGGVWEEGMLDGWGGGVTASCSLSPQLIIYQDGGCWGLICSPTLLPQYWRVPTPLLFMSSA